MPSILFVCTANQYRSPLAAAFFSKKLNADGEASGWIVESAGTWAVPGQGAPSDALLAARVIGLDLEDHLTRQIDRDLLARHDLIVVMEKGHREALRIEFPLIQKKVYLLSMIADQLEYDIADPANSDLTTIEIVTELSRLIDCAYPSICRLVQSLESI
jgi:protein-tyrosine-phosphatase